MSETQKHTKPNVPNLRFPAFCEEWEEVRLGEVLSKMENGMNYDINETEGYPVTRIETISGKSINMQRVGHVLNVDGKQRYRMEAGDILFSHINSLPHMGKTAYYEGDVELYHGMNLLLLRAKESVNSRFLYYQLNTPKNISRYQVIANRAVNQASINTKTLAGITLFLPSISEQQIISKFFKLLDQKLETQIRVIEDLKTLKAALCELLYDEREPNYLIGEIIEQTSIRNRNGENHKVLSVSNQLGFIDQSEQFEGRTIASQDTSNIGRFCI